ncbi:hypothetical protein [Flammeovirga aprica]|uniref:Uncharacterized protein n=1 Tax=Flammeovirga aprica JL-4 TaxID=694437 RepID=A0A7X9S171_9BACT|nr:hypothetical protein [Flammeovirga aprica]NME72369.1 hypothetical protein [Flammeovirga aprica JL-4]
MNKETIFFKNKEYKISYYDNSYIIRINDNEFTFGILLKKEQYKRLKEIGKILKSIDFDLHQSISMKEINNLSVYSNAYKLSPPEPMLMELMFDNELNIIYSYDCLTFDGYYSWYTKFSNNTIMGVWYEIT